MKSVTLRATLRRTTVALLPLLLVLRPADGANCIEHNYCNGHGTCNNAYSTCTCYDGWGAETDVNAFKRHDCGERTCPSGRAWGDLATGITTGHALAECSNRGLCERSSGVCECYAGFAGDACQRKDCPNDCSGHGRCVKMSEMATLPSALPLSNGTSTYTGKEKGVTWDEDMVYGCLCDSAWEVGLSEDETQEPEWFGFDCSLRHCPSADDPVTHRIDETDCYNTTSKGGFGRGTKGNKCHVDCANRGKCDFATGLCGCFTGFYGEDCASMSALAT